MKRIFVFILLFCLLCSCSDKEVSSIERIAQARVRFSSSLGAVWVYHSDAIEGEEGYIDSGLVGVMLGDGERPSEMSGVKRYSFLCSTGISLCEVWMLECYTYSAARDVYELFEKRKKLLTSPEYENERDNAAADGSALVREGKCVYFAVCENGDEVIGFLSGSSE